MKDMMQLQAENDELLAACKSLLTHCIDDLPVLPPEYQAAVSEAHAAIAKAEADYPHQGDLHNQEETPVQRVRRETKELFQTGDE